MKISNSKNYYKIIDLDEISKKLHRRISEKVPNASVRDIKEILYLHIALAKATIMSPNLKTFRIKYLGSFLVYSNVIFRYMVKKYKDFMSKKITKKDYEESCNRIEPWLEDLKNYKYSKRYDFNKADWEEYAKSNSKS